MKRRGIKCIYPSHPSHHCVSLHTLSGRKWRPLYLFIVFILVPHQLWAAWKNYMSVSAYVDVKIRLKRCMECVIRLCSDHVSPPSHLVKSWCASLSCDGFASSASRISKRSVEWEHTLLYWPLPDFTMCITAKHPLFLYNKSFTVFTCCPTSHHTAFFTCSHKPGVGSTGPVYHPSSTAKISERVGEGAERKITRIEEEKIEQTLYQKSVSQSNSCWDDQTFS